MSELKAFEVSGKSLFGRTYVKKVYLKSEVDELIADLEESHKKEVEQLLMEIVELKADYNEACDRLQTANLIKDEQKAKADKLLSCLKCLVIRDLIKNCPEKASAIEIVKAYK